MAVAAAIRPRRPAALYRHRHGGRDDRADRGDLGRRPPSPVAPGGGDASATMPVPARVRPRRGTPRPVRRRPPDPNAAAGRRPGVVAPARPTRVAGPTPSPTRPAYRWAAAEPRRRPPAWSRRADAGSASADPRRAAAPPATVPPATTPPDDVTAPRRPRLRRRPRRSRAAADADGASAWSDTTFTVDGQHRARARPRRPRRSPRRAPASASSSSRRAGRASCPTSELCRLNAAPGCARRGVARDVRRDRAGGHRLAGHWRPLRPDRARRARRRRATTATSPPSARSRARRRERVPRHAPAARRSSSIGSCPPCGSRPGVRLDLGGIGKGYAADLVARRARRGGRGRRVREPRRRPRGRWVSRSRATAGRSTSTRSSRPGRSFRLADGAVATSTRLRRHWTRDGEDRHHLIDPATGRPASSGLAAVTVLAASAAWAEVLAKAVFVAGRDGGARAPGRAAGHRAAGARRRRRRGPARVATLSSHDPAALVVHGPGDGPGRAGCS